MNERVFQFFSVEKKFKIVIQRKTKNLKYDNVFLIFSQNHEDKFTSLLSCLLSLDDDKLPPVNIKKLSLLCDELSK